MTIGIYMLTFEGLEEWPYVGQSQNIEDRYTAHKSSIKLGKSNFKLLEAFAISNKYPQLTILEKCVNTDNLDEKELYWIARLDSINNGLNLTDKVINKAYGEGNFNSKFSNETITNAFLFICENLHLSNKQLGDATNTSVSVVTGIMDGHIHLWLKDVFPDKYYALLNRDIKRVNSAKKQGIIYPKVISPEGAIYVVENLSEFAREYDLNKSSFHQMLTGKRKTCSKWKLYA